MNTLLIENKINICYFLPIKYIAILRAISKLTKQAVDLYAQIILGGKKGMKVFSFAAKIKNCNRKRIIDPWRIFLVSKHDFQECVECNRLHYKKNGCFCRDKDCKLCLKNHLGKHKMGYCYCSICSQCIYTVVP